MESAEPGLPIEVVYATEAEQVVQKLSVPAGTTLAGAIALSGLGQRFADIALNPPAIGVFGRRREPQEPVAAGDRIEIYRPLLADPKEARRRRVVRKQRR